MNTRMAAWGLGLTLASTGCVNAYAVSVPYTAQPERVADGRAALQGLVLTDVPANCSANVTFVDSPRTVVVTHTCSETILVGGDSRKVLSGDLVSSTAVRTRVLHLDQTQAMELQRQGDLYGVYVVHQAGVAPDFVYTTHSLNVAQRVYDAITSLQRSTQAATK